MDLSSIAGFTLMQQTNTFCNDRSQITDYSDGSAYRIGAYYGLCQTQAMDEGAHGLGIDTEVGGEAGNSRHYWENVLVNVEKRLDGVGVEVEVGRIIIEQMYVYKPSSKGFLRLVSRCPRNPRPQTSHALLAVPHTLPRSNDSKPTPRLFTATHICSSLSCSRTTNPERANKGASNRSAPAKTPEYFSPTEAEHPTNPNSSLLTAVKRSPLPSPTGPVENSDADDEQEDESSFDSIDTIILLTSSVQTYDIVKNATASPDGPRRAEICAWYWYLVGLTPRGAEFLQQLCSHRYLIHSTRIE